MSAAEWWKPWTDVVQAATAAVVAGFAALQLWREWRREAERARAAEARIGAAAFLVRRTICGWLGDDAPDGEPRHLEAWLRAAEGTGTLDAQLRDVERRMEELIALTADAPPAVAASVRRAYVYVLSGTSRLVAYAAGERPRGDLLFPQIQRRRDAVADLHAGMQALVASPTHKDLLRLHADLQARRRGEDPLVQLAGALPAVWWTVGPRGARRPRRSAVTLTPCALRRPP